MTDSRDVLSRPSDGPSDVVPYGELPDQVVDVWPGGGPAVVVVHGGFWRAEWDRRHTYPMCAALAADGYTVAAVEYRRVGQPGGGWPGTFDDLARAVDAVPRLLGVERPLLVGHSAGGQLALWAAARHRLPDGVPWRCAGRPPLAGVVGLAGVCDLAAAVRLGLDGGAAVDLLGGSSPDGAATDGRLADGRLADGRLAAADPVRLVGGGVRAILLHGDADPLVPLALSAAYADAATAAGDPVELRPLPGEGHFGVIDPASAAWPEVLRAVRDLAG